MIFQKNFFIVNIIITMAARKNRRRTRNRRRVHRGGMIKALKKLCGSNPNDPCIRESIE